jgi:hypothetical protein
MKKPALFFLFCMFAGQVLFAQTTYVGELNLNQKDKIFSLISPNDTLSVSIEKKDLDFNAGRDFQLIKIKNKEYQLIVKGDSIKLSESKSTIEFSNGLKFNVVTRKAHQLILSNEAGSTVVDALYRLKGNNADFEITIYDKESEIELLAYATKYLYEMSHNEVNTTVPYYFFMY